MPSLQAPSRGVSRSTNDLLEGSSGHGNSYQDDRSKRQPSASRRQLQEITNERKAKKVHFYRNGDRFHKGIDFAISRDRFRTYQMLLAELTSRLSVESDPFLNQGVRKIYDLQGNTMADVDDLEDKGVYVAASNEIFRKIPYNKIASSNILNSKKAGSRDILNNGRTAEQMGIATNGSQIEDQDKSFIRPKLITVIRNGQRPRKLVRILLNKRSAPTLERVLNTITDYIKLHTGAVKKIYTIDGQQIRRLRDFFREADVFMAFGSGAKINPDDFDLDVTECRELEQLRRPTTAENGYNDGWETTSSAPSRRSSDRRRGRSPHRVRSQRLRWQPIVVPHSCLLGGKHRGAHHSSSTGDLLDQVDRDPSQSKKSGWKSAEDLCSVSNKKPAIQFSANPKTAKDGKRNPITMKYAVHEKIGDGNFAVVKRCVERATQQEYALKIIDKAKCKGKLHMIHSEVFILKKVRHPNIILLVEDWDGPTEVYMVMEYVKGGDLFDAIQSATRYTERDASSMIYNLCSALCYLHEMNIVHRDVKPENLLVCCFQDGSKALKLGDFGLAIKVERPIYTVCGTPTYVAPEVLAEAGYGLKIDVWSAGVIAYILLCGFPPYRSESGDQQELFYNILHQELIFLPPFWDEVSYNAKYLIRHMLERNVARRFTAQEALSHEWLAEDNASLEDHDMKNYVGRNIRQLRTSTRGRDGASGKLIAITALDKELNFSEPSVNGYNENGEVEDLLKI